MRQFKRIIKIAGINLLVLLVLLSLLETGLRLAGHKTPLQQQTETPEHSIRIEKIRAVADGRTFQSWPSFYTNGEGVFIANRDFFRENPEGIVINADGFRGRPFEPAHTRRHTVLLLGDSFTWGRSATPIAQCFADLLDGMGYHVFNGGIPGVDPGQYKALAQKYVPRLKPDVTAVCICMGNDLRASPLQMVPHRNLHYATNVGFLLGYDDSGRFFDDARQAFDYLLRAKCGAGLGFLDFLAFKTVIGGAVRRLLHPPLPPHPRGKMWLNDCFRDIQAVCRQHNSRCIFFLIPHRFNKKQTNIAANLKLFNGVESHYPVDFRPETDYMPPPDNHFNNGGHRKFAAFIAEILTQRGFPPEGRL